MRGWLDTANQEGETTIYSGPGMEFIYKIIEEGNNIVATCKRALAGSESEKDVAKQRFAQSVYITHWYCLCDITFVIS